MKKLYLLSVLMLLLFASCKKDDMEAEEYKNPKHELRFTNISVNPYEIEFAGPDFVLDGNSYHTYNLTPDSYDWKVTQQSGYLLFPTVQSGTIVLNQDAEIVFP